MSRTLQALNLIPRCLLSLLTLLTSALFRCRCRNLSRVWGRRDAAYQTCLDCGATFPFDWDTMTRGKRVERN